MRNDVHHQLDAAIAAVPGWSKATVEVQPLVGGLMNSNWLARHEGKTYFMKIYGAGTEAFVNRQQSVAAARQAHDLGISPQVLHYDPVAGVEVVEFLTEHRASTNADFTRRDFLDSAIDLYAKLHAGPSLASTKHIFEMVDEHFEQGDRLDVIRTADFPWLRKQYQKAKDAFLASGLDLVPCHSDPMPGNFMVRLERDCIADMQLIDFEFAANNERAYEIAVFLAEVFVDEQTSLELLERYYGNVNPKIVARIWVARAIADIKWGSWAVQQRKLSDWDFDYQKYGIWKYARARMLFNDPRWDDWLRRL
jgi:thiamine kinase-like enzyme